MIKISPNIINKVKKFETPDEKQLSLMVERSKELMSEYGTLFKSKTLEELYTPEYNYNGVLPRTTYIIDKKTGEKKLIFIFKGCKNDAEMGPFEKYTACTYGLSLLGQKSFRTRSTNGVNRIDTGVMKSFNNDRYSGTQIRLTQIEVERAIQLNAESIPLHSVSEALPFHTMMGFRPNETYNTEVKTVAEVNQRMGWLIDACSGVKKEHFTPIVHFKDGKYYFDENQTVANATLRHFRQEVDEGVKRNFHSIFVGNSVKMNLSGKELEAWKQRALSQPILLKQNK